ncbi:DUF402 domain-containing protein [Actinoplanes sp. CA-054009]
MNVEVVLRKYDGRLHRRLVMRRLGEDAHGAWLGAPAGTTVHSGVPGRDFVTRHDTVRLVPVGQWWTAIFFAEPGEWDVYCDITTPAVWREPGSVVMVDLDLDVQRERDSGRVELLDEDEFEVNARAYGYPADVVAGARGAAERLVAGLGSRVEPFGVSGKGWLQL